MAGKGRYKEDPYLVCSPVVGLSPNLTCFLSSFTFSSGWRKYGKKVSVQKIRGQARKKVAKLRDDGTLEEELC